MTLIYRFLFPESNANKRTSLLILALRILFGLLLMSHGVQKWSQFDALSTTFPDPTGLGSQFSLVLAIFAELFCSMLFIVGFLYRAALLPMITTMGVAFFKIHGGSIVTGGELAFIYLTVFIILFITGSGRFSIDNFISQLTKKKSSTEM